MPNKATFDLYDAPLDEAFGHFQGLPDESRFCNYVHNFTIDPQNWLRYEPPSWVYTLAWREYRYADIQTRRDLDNLIPENEPGIYIFYARAKKLVYNFPQFAFYIGISNERNSQRMLRERLKDYLPSALKLIRKRQNVHRMLQLFYENIWVAFALSSESSANLAAAEEKLHGYLYPCYNRRDFPVAIKRQQKAFGGI